MVGSCEGNCGHGLFSSAVERGETDSEQILWHLHMQMRWGASLYCSKSKEG